MKEFKVVIPEECYSILNFHEEALPGIAVVNSALKGFEPKEVFAWHLSIRVELKDLVDKGMPSRAEVKVIDSYGDFLDKKIKGEDEAKPNALFLARLTWNGTRELIWRVYDPQIAHDLLQGIIEAGDQVREFNYQMKNDQEWKLTEWLLRA